MVVLTDDVAITIIPIVQHVKSGAGQELSGRDSIN